MGEHTFKKVGENGELKNVLRLFPWVQTGVIYHDLCLGDTGAFFLSLHKNYTLLER